VIYSFSVTTAVKTRDLVRSASPSTGHKILVQLERYFKEFTIITQNVDGLHEKAGSSRVLELHGNIFRNQLVTGASISEDEIDWTAMPPTTQEGKLVRPAVVYFGEIMTYEDVTIQTKRTEQDNDGLRELHIQDIRNPRSRMSFLHPITAEMLTYGYLYNVFHDKRDLQSRLKQMRNPSDWFAEHDNDLLPLHFGELEDRLKWLRTGVPHKT
jgi:hypothetical protein